MAQLFSDLSYSTAKALPIGRPVDDLSALYKKKEEDYLTGRDTYYKAGAALDNIPYHQKDAAIIKEAKDVYNQAFTKAEEEGDFENKIPDSQKLANDLATKYGLLEAQKIAQTKQNYITGLKERFDKGNISKYEMDRAIQDAEDNYKGLEYDENIGGYVGSYQTREVLDKYNASEEVAKILDGFKANTVILTDANGNTIKKDPSGSGYLITGTNERVGEEELVAAAKSYLAHDPRFRDKVEDELYYETKNLLYNRETGERREMTVNDLQNLVGTKVSQSIANAYNINNLESLPEVLKAKGETVEDLYKQLRKEQMVNSAIQLGVSKESYDKYSANYLTDWLMKEQVQNTKTDATTFGQTGALHSFLSTDNLSSDDTKRISTEYTNNEESIKTLTAELTDLRNNYNNDPKSVNPQTIRMKEEELNRVRRKQDIINNRMHTVIEETPDIKKHIDSLLSNQFVANEDFEKLGMSNFKNKYPRSLTWVGIEGLNINRGSVERLIYKMIGNDVSTDELKTYINLDKNKVLAEAYKVNQRYFSNRSPEEKEAIYNDLLERGEAALEGKENNVIKEKLQNAYNDRLDTSANLLRAKLKDIVSTLNKKTDNQEITYSKEFKLFNLPDLKPEELRSHPIHQLKHLAENLPKIDANYYTQLSSPITGLDIKTTIEEVADEMGLNVSDEKGDIDWRSAVMSPSIDTMVDVNSGEYSPVVVMQVDVKTGDSKNPTRTIQVPVNYNEPSYKAKYREAINLHRKQLLEKAKVQRLDESDELVLNRLNTNLYNISEYGKNLDNLDLFNAKNAETIPFEYWNGHHTQIKAFKYKSAQNMSFYLTEGTGDNEKYWAVDKQGNYAKVTEDQLHDDTYTALGGNSPADLKTLLSNMVFDSYEPQKDYRIDVSQTVDISNIFGGDIKTGVTPRVTKQAADSLGVIKTFLPNLMLTDALRPDDAGYGATNSQHKYANAVDFRINEDSSKLANMSKSQLNMLGIASASIHDQGTPNAHIHVEFLK